MACSKFVIFLLIFFAFIILSAGCISTLEYPGNLQKNERYKLVIDSSDPLHEATFYIPLPVKDNAPEIGTKLINVSDFTRGGFSVDITQVVREGIMGDPHQTEYALRGDNPWYLQIHAYQWPKGRSEWNVEDGLNELSSPLLFYNTLYPVGNESLLLPKLEFYPPENLKIMKKYSDYATIYYVPQKT